MKGRLKDRKEMIDRLRAQLEFLLYYLIAVVQRDERFIGNRDSIDDAGCWAVGHSLLSSSIDRNRKRA